ncbi:hypothetical protein [Ruegeria atlantica]|uniref:hypothetical protein n=1 Tax=Ruegeria atlantica TaxID=81569 RepID=UPI00147FFAC7|nr:hypothetical protein [Ruegeria atlantica]
MSRINLTINAMRSIFRAARKSGLKHSEPGLIWQRKTGFGCHFLAEAGANGLVQSKEWNLSNVATRGD